MIINVWNVSFYQLNAPLVYKEDYSLLSANAKKDFMKTQKKNVKVNYEKNIIKYEKKSYLLIIN